MGFQAIAKIYTDGACSGNPGPGGWGTVVYFADESIHEMGGSDPQTTNNRMEMQAAIDALKFLQESNQKGSATSQFSSGVIALYTDSEYVKNGITKWIKGWKQKGWKTSTGKPVLNQDLWEILDALNSNQIEWRYVRGHTGDIGNERCDAIARAFSLGKIPALKTFTHQIHEPEIAMTDASLPTPVDLIDELPREDRVASLRNLVETLQMADEIASKAYLITSSELADLMDVNASAVTSRGDNWVWRNWVVSRVRREGNQILWQLERVD